MVGFYAFTLHSEAGLLPPWTMALWPVGAVQITQLPRKMMERMRQRCVHCVVKGAPPPQFVVCATNTMVLNVLTLTLVGITLVIRNMTPC